MLIANGPQLDDEGRGISSLAFLLTRLGPIAIPAGVTQYFDGCGTTCRPQGSCAHRNMKPRRRCWEADQGRAERAKFSVKHGKKLVDSPTRPIHHELWVGGATTDTVVRAPSLTCAENA